MKSGVYTREGKSFCVIRALGRKTAERGSYDRRGQCLQCLWWLRHPPFHISSWAPCLPVHTQFVPKDGCALTLLVSSAPTHHLAPLCT